MSSMKITKNEDGSITVTDSVTISEESPEIPNLDESDENKNLENKQENKNLKFLDEIKAMGDAIEQIKKENPAALNNFYYIYSAIQELQGNLNVKISWSRDRQTFLTECQITLPNLTFNLEGTENSPLESLVDLTEKLRPIVDKFADDKKAINPCSIM